MEIKAKDLKPGDVFVYDNKEQVAIDTISNNFLWVTTRNSYLTKDKIKSGFSYGYTNSVIININANDTVELIKNIEK